MNPTLVLVEGESDAGAVRALAKLIDCDLASRQIQIMSAGGVTNFARVLSEFMHDHPGAKACGLYDVADEWHVRRALKAASAPIEASDSVESYGFFACVDDLEDELIRALGAQAVELEIDAEGELASFRRFQAMPEHRESPAHDQLHRFLGTRATRKIRMARRLVEVIEPGRLPRPLAQLSAALQAASLAPR